MIATPARTASRLPLRASRSSRTPGPTGEQVFKIPDPEKTEIRLQLGLG